MLTVYLEAMVDAGHFFLVKKEESIRVSLVHHRACPAIYLRPEDNWSGNPAAYRLSGLLHLARGPPVVWFVMSCAEVPSGGEWKLVGGNNECICLVTVCVDDLLL